MAIRNINKMEFEEAIGKVGILLFQHAGAIPESELSKFIVARIEQDTDVVCADSEAQAIPTQ